jgi:hypothetical protein
MCSLRIFPVLNIGGKLTKEKISIEESGIFRVDPTWDFFMDVVKEKFYPVGSYDDQYMRWTTLMHQK